ncbi:MAG: enoyl-CoA hydratase/isomerase family protein [Gammaproteobacteria bacterium]|nr:enoyl-CoA hydratase/isomerase family protein [Gammaproteobacteria bacterium]
MSTSFIKTRIEHGILTVLINRPEKRNALSQAVLAELGATFHQHASNSRLLAAVLHGAGERCFAAGGDLVEFDQVREPAAVRAMQKHSVAALDAVRTFPVPVIGALNGDAIGGGAELALACDMRVLAHHARIAFVQGQMCIAPAWGGGADLMQLVGTATALRLLSSTEFIAAEVARELGIAQMVAGAEEAFEAVVERFIKPLRERKPQVMRAFKSLALTARQSERWHAVRAAEPGLLLETWLHDDHWAASDAVLERIARQVK